VEDLGDLGDLIVEEAGGVRVGDHQAAVFAVALGAQVVQVNPPVLPS
jgi:hypothetical protein